MDSSHQTKKKKDSRESSHFIFRSMNQEVLETNKNRKDAKTTVDIPTLDDMTSYLFANEVIEKEELPKLTAQQDKSINIPEIITGENDHEENQTLSTRTREKSDSSSVFNQFNPEESKKEIETLYKMAQSLASNGEYQQAINFYNRIVGLNEKSGSAWIALGHCYAMIEQDHKALASYEQALKHVPNSQKDEQLWYGIGLLYQKLEDWNSAEMSFRNALRLDPNPNLKGEILYNLGMVMRSKGDYAEAIKYLTKCILSEAFPPEKIVEILCISGNLQEKINDIEGAIKVYNYAVMLQENNPRALLCLGWLLFQIEKIEQALNFFTKAEALLPKEAEITYLIARCHLRLKQHTTAYDCLHKCLTKDPNNHIYWSSLGILFGELKQLKQCYECFKKAVKYDSRCPEHFYNFGSLFELSNQFKDALSMFDKAIELDSNFVLALNSKKRLIAQNEDRNSTLEVQFKHPAFDFSLIEEIKNERTSYFFTQQQTPRISEVEAKNAREIQLKNRFASDDFSNSTINPQSIKNLDLQLQNKLQKDNSPDLLKLVSAEHLSLSNPDKVGKLGGKQENKEHSHFRVESDSDISSMKLARPLLSDTNSTKLPSVQSLTSSISGLNSFSILQNNYNNVNNFVINPVMNHPMESESNLHNNFEQASSLGPGRSKTEDLSSSVKFPNELAKQLSGLQAIIAKNNNILQNTIIQNLSMENLKPIKNTSSPIVLRHNPQVLSLYENVKKPDIIKPQNKIELKVIHRLNRSEEDELIVQKKIKTENNSSSISPMGN